MRRILKFGWFLISSFHTNEYQPNHSDTSSGRHREGWNKISCLHWIKTSGDCNNCASYCPEDRMQVGRILIRFWSGWGQTNPTTLLMSSGVGTVLLLVANLREDTSPCHFIQEFSKCVKRLEISAVFDPKAFQGCKKSFLASLERFWIENRRDLQPFHTFRKFLDKMAWGGGVFPQICYQQEYFNHRQLKLRYYLLFGLHLSKTIKLVHSKSGNLTSYLSNRDYTKKLKIFVRMSHIHKFCDHFKQSRGSQWSCDQCL